MALPSSFARGAGLTANPIWREGGIDMEREERLEPFKILVFRWRRMESEMRADPETKENAECRDLLLQCARELENVIKQLETP